MNTAVYANAIRGLIRGRLLVVAVALALIFCMLQAMAIANERHMLRQERDQVATAARTGAVPMTGSGKSKLTADMYLDALRADSAAALREEALHYETLFLVFMSLFALGAVFGRESAHGGLDRVLTAPVSGPAAAASLLGATFVFTQSCITVLFMFLEFRLHVFSAAPAIAVYKYAMLTAMHCMILSLSFLCHVLFGRNTAFAASAALVFLGFASYAIHIAGGEMASPALRAAAHAYTFAMPQMGTLFFEALNRVRPGVFPKAGVNAWWYIFEAFRTAVILGAGLYLFNKKN